MGNRGLSRSLGLGNKTKEFQSIVPFPSNETSRTNRKENVKTRTIQEGGRIDDHQVKDAAPTYDFKESEGKIRRDNLANFESECSQIGKFIFVSGMKVAADYDLLIEKRIKRILNCAPMISPNFHESTGSFKYLSINLVDGRVEDISWFVCQAVQFITEGILRGERVLIHCEKGVSRSCSVAIAHRMWQTGESWKISFDFVKTHRRICSPNTAFTVNLIELTELFTGAASTATLLFRLAYHAAYDPDTPVLKLCRNEANRRILVPATSLLNPKAVFVLRAVRRVPNHDPNNISNSKNFDHSGSLIFQHDLYVWMGKESTVAAQDMGVKQARLMIGVFSQSKDVKVVKEGHEPAEFLNLLAADGPFQRHSNNGVATYSDYYGACRPTEAELQEAAALRDTAAITTQEFIRSMLAQGQHNQESQSSLGTETAPPTSTTVSRSNSSAKLSLPLMSSAISGSGNNNISDDNGGRPRSRSNTAMSFNNNATDLTVSIPAALSRANSFSSIDSDGQSVFSREERLSRINNIIEAAVSSANNSSPVLGSNVGSGNNPSSGNNSSNSSREKRRPMNRHRGDETTGSDNDLDNSSLDTVESPVTLNGNKNTTSNGRIMSIDRRDAASDGQRLKKDPDGQNASVSGMTLSNPVARLPEVRTGKNDTNGDMTRAPTSFVLGIGSYPLTEARDSASNSAVNTSRPSSVAASSRKVTGAGSLSPPSSSLPLHDNNTSTMTLSSLGQINSSGLNANAVPSRNSKFGLEVSLALPVPESSPSLTLDQQPSDLSPPLMNRRRNSGQTLSLAAMPTEVLSEPVPANSGLEQKKLPNKPMLFQIATTDEGNAVGQWVGMGVYDDEDLDQQNALLLFCPTRSHFLWIGKESEFYNVFSSFSQVQDANEIGPWLQSKVSLGELTDWQIDWLHDYFQVETPDEESDEFWEKFNEGY